MVAFVEAGKTDPDTVAFEEEATCVAAGSIVVDLVAGRDVDAESGLITGCAAG